LFNYLSSEEQQFQQEVMEAKDTEFCTFNLSTCGGGGCGGSTSSITTSRNNNNTISSSSSSSSSGSARRKYRKYYLFSQVIICFSACAKYFSIFCLLSDNPAATYFATDIAYCMLLTRFELELLICNVVITLRV
jgi:hypothetical protein